MPWPGKISSSLAAINAAALFRQPNPLSDGWLTRVFSATLKFGQSDSSWNTQRMPSRCARTTE